MPKQLSPREQYALAYQFLRCRLAMEFNPAGQERTYRGFGIGHDAYEAAWDSMGWSSCEFGGWRDYSRQFDFEEARGRL